MTKTSAMTDPDQSILDEIRAGNTKRFAALVDRHKDRALTLALRLVGNREDAEEVVQDGFMRAYRSLAEFRRDSRFSTWFYRILYNLCMSRVTRRTSREVLQHVEEEITELTAPPEDTDTLLALQDRELQNILRDEMNRLPEKFAAAVTLFYVQEMTYDEISAVTGQPVGSVKTNLFRGRQALRKRVLTRVGEEMKES